MLTLWNPALPMYAIDGVFANKPLHIVDGNDAYKDVTKLCIYPHYILRDYKIQWIMPVIAIKQHISTLYRISEYATKANRTFCPTCKKSRPYLVG